MADKKVSELTKVSGSELSNVDAIGIRDGMAVRYSLGNLTSTLMNSLSGVITPDSQAEFSTELIYYPGQFCRYNGNTWRFMKFHAKGEGWIGSDAYQTDFWKEYSSITTNDYETLYAHVSFLDETGAVVSGQSLEGISVSVAFDDGSSNTVVTDSDGIASFTIKKGTHYVLSSQSSDLSDYTRPVPQDFTASISSMTVDSVTYGGRVANLIYHKGTDSDCTVRVHICIDGEGYTESIYSGLVAVLEYPHGEYESRSLLKPQSRTIVYNSSASSDADKNIVTFYSVKQGSYCSVYLPYILNFIDDINDGFFVSGTEMDVYMKVQYTNDNGIFYVVGETDAMIPGTETPAAWKEFKLADYPGYSSGTYDSTNYPLYAIHVNTDYLAEFGMDYYIKPESLFKQSGYISGGLQWCTAQGTLHPHVVTTYTKTSPMDCNGKLMTAYMMHDSARFLGGLSSPAAEWASKQTFEVNGKSLSGFIGTRSQMEAIFNATTHTDLDTAMAFFGLGATTYYSGTTFWSSTQYNANNAWNWYSGSHWNNYTKTNYYCVFPFFAI